MSLLVTRPQLTDCRTHIPLLNVAAALARLLLCMLCNYARSNTNTNALIALPSNLLIPRTVSIRTSHIIHRITLYTKPHHWHSMLDLDALIIDMLTIPLKKFHGKENERHLEFDRAQLSLAVVNGYFNVENATNLVEKRGTKCLWFNQVFLDSERVLISMLQLSTVKPFICSHSFVRQPGL